MTNTSGRPRAVSIHNQIHIRPHQLPGHLIHVLRRHADERPRQPAFVHLLNGQADHASLTYAQLDRRARAIAACLQDMGFAGQCVLLVYPPGLDFVTAFFGCLYAGCVAVRPTRRIATACSSASRPSPPMPGPASP